MLKAFWVLTPPPFWVYFLKKNASHWGNVKHVKNLKGIPTKKASHWGNVENVKNVKSFQGLGPSFSFFGWGVKTQKTFNIFNISPVLSTFL